MNNIQLDLSKISFVGNNFDSNEFVKACIENDINSLKNQYEMNKDINEDYIHYAARKICNSGNLEILKLLYNWFPFILNNNLLSISINSGQIDILKFFHNLDPNIKINSYDFTVCCKKNHTEIIKLLYEWNPSLIKSFLQPTRTIKLNNFAEVCRNNNIELMKLFYSWCPAIKFVLNADSYLVFREASWDGHLEILQQFYKWCPNIPEREYTESFKLACKYGHDHIIEQLYEWDPEIIKDIEEAFDLACINNHLKTIKLLILWNPEILKKWSILFKISNEKYNQTVISLIREYL
jgi:hypothetical protein